MKDQDEKFIKEAIMLSEQNLQLAHGGPFGAIIVQDGNIIARGWNQVLKLKDPTAHAEIMAIRNACTELDDYILRGTTIYTSCEPCPMCLAAIHWARIDRIVYANTRKDAADIGFDDDFLYIEIAKNVTARLIPSDQLMQAEARKIFDKWLKLENKTLY